MLCNLPLEAPDRIAKINFKQIEMSMKNVFYTKKKKKKHVELYKLLFCFCFFVVFLMTISSLPQILSSSAQNLIR